MEDASKCLTSSGSPRIHGARWMAGVAVAVEWKDSSIGAWALALGRTLASLGTFTLGVGRSVALFAIVTQGATMGMQAWEERQLAPQIEAMRAEQAWLVGQGLAPMRRIGVLGEGVWLHTGVKGRTTHEGPDVTIGGEWDASAIVVAWARLMSRAGGPDVLRSSNAISVGEPGQQRNGFTDIYGFAYRHEEAHALVSDFHIEPGTPGAWPKEVSSGLGPELGLGASFSWRSDLIRGLWDESFADAFAVLSSARRGPDAFKKTALAANKARAMPSAMGDDALSALDAAGNNHAVDMASFLAGQFDSESVAKLGAPDLRALAKDVADASVAWGIARQAPALDFFNEAGFVWWMRVSETSGMGAAPAKTAWALWRSGAMAALPKAAFGSFAWSHGGMEFRAKGLSESAGAAWRFDGYGGALRLSGAKDLESSGSDGGQQWKELGAVDVKKDSSKKASESGPSDINGSEPSAWGNKAESMRTAIKESLPIDGRLESFDAAGKAYLTLATRMGVELAPEMATLARDKALLIGSKSSASKLLKERPGEKRGR